MLKLQGVPLVFASVGSRWCPVSGLPHGTAEYAPRGAPNDKPREAPLSQQRHVSWLSQELLVNVIKFSHPQWMNWTNNALQQHGMIATNSTCKVILLTSNFFNWHVVSMFDQLIGWNTSAPRIPICCSRRRSQVMRARRDWAHSASLVPQLAPAQGRSVGIWGRSWGEIAPIHVTPAEFKNK